MRARMAGAGRGLGAQSARGLGLQRREVAVAHAAGEREDRRDQWVAPVLVPGQLFSPQILEFMRSLDTPEVHGYDPQAGYRVYTAKALEIAQDERA